jgi:hypothetical protein
VAAIWGRDGGGWKLLSQAGFPDEASLHRLVEEAPQVLPLAGEPNLVVVGREVQLGSGFADLVAIEPTGRLALIEIKLAKNAESRRAVVAQLLAYAAYLDRLAVDQVESIVAVGLKARGWSSLADAAASAQTVDFDPTEFRTALTDNLNSGRFRLVFVLDEVPPELTRLVGYLARISPEVVIDLLKVAAYDVNGAQVIVPQRVEPERLEIDPIGARKRSAGPMSEALGIGPFLDAVEQIEGAPKARLEQLLEWAEGLEREGSAKLVTTVGVKQLALKPLLIHGAGLVTVWFYGGNAYLRLWRSAIERHAPASITSLEQVLGGTIPATYIDPITVELLDCLSDAYREANSKLTLPAIAGAPSD